jgi:uncharacterized protein YndB with AHSA1/START domain
VSEDGKRNLEKTVTIEATPDAVWRALTDAEQIVRWFALDARVVPGEGGHVWLSWPGMAGAERIEVWQEGKHLRTRGDRPQIATDWYIEGAGGQTTLRLVQSGFGEGAAWDDELDALDRGWTVYLKNLKHMLERHPTGPSRQVMFPLPVPGLALEEVWARLVGPDGLGLPRAGLGPYRARAATGETLEGQVDLWSPPRALALTVRSLDDARLTVDIGGCNGEATVWLAILTYGLDEATVAAVETRWRPVLEGLFPKAPPASKEVSP